jgi:hypothetical protein
MMQEPGFPQDAGILGLDNVIALNLQHNVVANASAKRAGRILDNRQL